MLGIWRDPWGIVGTPTTYVIGADGRIMWRHYGFAPGDEVVLRERVLELLGLPP